MRESSRPASVATRPPRGEARREHIAEAALAVIADGGPDALTHRRVAAEAGLPVAATTYWFGSKEELVLAAFDRAADRDLARLADRRAMAKGWTRATIAEELARALHQHIAEDRSVAVLECCFWVETLRRPELHTVAERWTGAYLDFYTELLQRIEPTTTAEDDGILSAGVEGLFLRELTYGPPREYRHLAIFLERLFGALLDRND